MQFKDDNGPGKLLAIRNAQEGDLYVLATIDFAVRWAEIMENKIAQNISIKDCIIESSHEADTDRITGFMASMAAVLLNDIWLFGDGFLRAWNERYSI